MVLESFVALRTAGDAIVRHPGGGSVADHLPSAREAALAPIERGSTRPGEAMCGRTPSSPHAQLPSTSRINREVAIDSASDAARSGSPEDFESPFTDGPASDVRGGTADVQGAPGEFHPARAPC